MSVINNNLLLTAAAGGATAGRSVRFNAPDSAYLSRTPASAGNRKTWTWSGWVKRSKLAANNYLLGSASNSSNYAGLFFNSSDQLSFVHIPNANTINTWTNAVFRDVSAWYHVVVAVDTTQSTGANGVKIYVNNVQQTLTIDAYTQNADTLINSTNTHGIGALGSTFIGLDGYLALVHFIDGQALTPSSFGETSATTGRWEAKTYAGTYGTNGFFLEFLDDSGATATTLGKDTSGNGNNWTPNNLSVTAGSGNDSLRDHPTSAGTSTGLGGEVSGNYCTLNPLAITNLPATPSNGNLETTGNRNSYGTIALPSSGKWYWEVTPTAGTDPMIGMAAYDSTTNSAILQTSVFYYINGNKYITGTGTAYGASYALNDVIGVAANIDAGTVTFYKNNTSQGAITFNAAGLFPASTTGGGSATYTFNFGQRAWAYACPSGFSPLVDTLLPTPTIAKPNTVMDVALYTGNGSSQSVTGLGFSPDLAWIKRRGVNSDHNLFDTVRGATKVIKSNNTDAEVTASTSLTAFNSDGFTVGSNSDVNGNTHAIVAWTWDAGSSNATNTSGTITSTVRANISAGFSIVTWTGTSASGTVGHGLGVKPSLIIGRRRDGVANWCVYHISTGASQRLDLNATSAASSNTTRFDGVEPTSTVFSVGSSGDLNAGNALAYCWTSVAGYSAFGSYTGNGSSDGPFVYTGFRPRWVMVKKTNSASISDWVIQDAGRDTYNPSIYRLYSNLSNAEDSGSSIDFLSNGFKIRVPSAYANINETSSTYIYACFAESPLPYARAR